MFTAKDGKNFGNHEMGKHYDSTRPAGKSSAPEAKSAGTQSESHADDGPQHEVLSEHGPATHTEIHGPGKSGDGSHHVHSHHEDGHHHVSKGHDLESAHDHSEHMMGGEAPGGEGHEEPDGDEATRFDVEDAIPGMKS